MHNQRQRNHAVGNEHAEVFADRRVAKEVLGRRRRDDEQQVEQDTAQQRLAVGRAPDARAAHQNGCARVQANLLMRAIGLEGAHVLYEDELAPAGEHGGNHDGDHAHMVHMDAGSIGHRAVLAHGAELLADTRFHDAHIEQTQEPHHQERDHGHRDHAEQRGHRGDLIQQAGRRQNADGNAALFGVQALGQHQHHQQRRDDAAADVQRGTEAELPQAVQRVLDASAGAIGQVDGVGHAGRPLDDQAGRVERDEVSEDEEEQQLIQAVGKVAQDQAADHFLALHLIEQLADQEAKQGRNGHGQKHGQQESAKSAHAPFDHPQGGDLRGHGADSDGEVDAHAGHDGNNQRQHDKGVAAEAAKHLIDDVGHRLAGINDADDAQEHEHHRNGVVAHPCANVPLLTHASHLQTWSAHTG